jgi:hypothetical protein
LCREKFLDRISRRALELLKESDSPQQEMAWAEDRLFQANMLWVGQPNRKNLSEWIQQAIADNPAILDESVPWMMERGSQPEDAETFEGLILKLIPSEGGL